MNYLGGILYTGVTSGCTLILLGIGCFFFAKPGKTKVKQIIDNIIFSLIIIIGLIFVTRYCYAYYNPNIEVAEGIYLSQYNGPGFLGRSYVFDISFEEKHPHFNSNPFSIRKMYYGGFSKGEKYRIYYETDTKVIVRIEDIKNQGTVP